MMLCIEVAQKMVSYYHFSIDKKKNSCSLQYLQYLLVYIGHCINMNAHSFDIQFEPTV